MFSVSVHFFVTLGAVGTLWYITLSLQWYHQIRTQVFEISGAQKVAKKTVALILFKVDSRLC
jgi:hypothetical protein